jgi:uncharacterized membrane protein YhaH (DUF805 family)
MDWYLKVLKNYAGFDGRARRTEYWMFFLFSLIISVVLTVIDGVVGMRSASGFGILSSLYSLAVLVPSIAVGIRRLHDTGKSGWWLFISLVPLIGGIWLIVLLATAGNVGSNQYGADPKAA